MDIKIFSDLVDALAKITDALKEAASSPEAEREQVPASHRAELPTARYHAFP